MRQPNDIESQYLWREYSRIELDSPPLRRFLDEIYATLSREITFGPDHSLLDVGCGRGYFVEYLRQRGHTDAYGIDPCELLLENRIAQEVIQGSFEENPYPDASFDVVFTCHTLHHLPQRDPHFAIQEMLRLTKRYMVIVEINNTNVPMFLISALNYRVERSAAFYNRRKVVSLVADAGAEVVYSTDMAAGYVSGDSLLYRSLARLGSRPYNIVVGLKKYGKRSP
jgi:ubiquinone/menaquinone biosynthesis C-methylase UbiE